MHTNRQIILASASPRRKELLKNIFPVFQIIPSSKEEETVFHTPEAFVMDLSHTKAEDIMQQHISHSTDISLEMPSLTAAPISPCLVIGSDTIVVFENRILGKPKDRRDAAETLEKLQGNTHQVYTGVTVLVKKNGKWEKYSFAECTDVTFYPVTDEEIHAYIKSGEPMDKAGSYGIQGSFGIYVKEIHGEYTNVVGLPVGRLFYELKKLGIELRG